MYNLCDVFAIGERQISHVGTSLEHVSLVQREISIGSKRDASKVRIISPRSCNHGPCAPCPDGPRPLGPLSKYDKIALLIDRDDQDISRTVY